jgi:AraC-like DNA-binding protein
MCYKHPLSDEIKRLYVDENLNIKEVGTKLGISKSTVYREILKNPNWKRKTLDKSKLKGRSKKHDVRLNEEQIIKLFQDGQTQQEIASNLGTSRWQIQKILKQNRVFRKAGHYISEESKTKLNDSAWLREQHWSKNKSIQEISQELGVSTTPVFSAFKKFNIQIKKPNQHYLTIDALQKAMNKDFLIEEHHNKKKTITELAKELGYSKANLSFIFDRLGIEVHLHKIDTSSTELELVEDIKKIYSGTIIANDRKQICPKELDVFFPEKNLAIEVNGVLWHSSKHVEKDYHLKKTIACKKKQIKLLHFWDIQIIKQRKIVLSMIANQLGLSKSIFARECQIRELTNSEARSFFFENHIQGYAASSYIIGLIHNSDIVAAMSFSKSRYSSQEYELIRFANKLNHRVIGGASKLLSHFKKQCNPQSIVSYADNSYSDGHLYETLGFKFSHTTPPNYSYLVGSKIESRQKYQKKNLQKLLKQYNSSLTEELNMKNNGYYRLYNCGQSVYVLDLMSQ